MGFISIDLGTTNIKVAAYDDQLKELAIENENVIYIKDGKIVEFDAGQYYDMVETTIARCCKRSFSEKPFPIRQIILTGQAESLIVVDKEMRPLRNGISWLDMRSGEE